MSSALPIRRVVLYKHGVGYLERKGKVEGNASLLLDFKTRDMNDVLKSMTVLDLSGGTISAVSYDSTKPLEKLLEEATIRLPEDGSLHALLGQVKGARVRVKLAAEALEGAIVGIDTVELARGEAKIDRAHLTLLVAGSLRTVDLLEVRELTFLDEAVRKDLEFYLATVLSSYKKDNKRVTILTAGEGQREVFVSYVLETPVWKTSYRILLDASGEPPLIQGWALVDNTGDEDWEQVELSLVAGLPVSFVHDLYQPRYVRRPVVHVQTESAAAPVIPQESYGGAAYDEAEEELSLQEAAAPPARAMRGKGMASFAASAMPPPAPAAMGMREAATRSQAVTTLTQEVGDLFEYRVGHPVSVMRNQSALVPILQAPFEGKRVLLYNRATRPKNPMACLELVNTTGLTLEGGPVTVTEEERYVGEAMLDTMKPSDRRLVPFAVELGCVVSVEDQSEQGSVFRASVNRGVLTTEHYRFQNTHYRVRNKAKRKQTLLLEHPKAAAWELDETAAPAEETDGFYRFKLELEPEKETVFRVRMRTRGHQTFSFDSASREDLKFFLASGYLDQRLGQAVEELIALRERGERLNAEAQSLGQERQQIFEDQKRIRANLESLQKAGSTELGARLIKQLAQQEDRLEEIAARLKQLELAKQQARAEVSERMKSLQLTRELGAAV